MIAELRALLEADEGDGDHLVYVDHLGKATVGIGHLILDDDEEAGWPVGTPVTEERVTELFNKDVKTVKHHEALDRQFWMTAAEELRSSKLYRQTPERTERHAKRLENLT